MNIQRLVVITLLAACSLLWAACTSTEETTQQQSAPPTEPARDARTDSIRTPVPGTEKSPYDTRTPAAPSGTYSVQVGAYKMPDNADRIGDLAKERFGKNVYIVHDAATDLYKVLVGDFLSKDDARNFRDEMVRLYPTDYRDAWVFENARK